MDENFRYDVRVRERFVDKGLLKEEDVQKYLDALVDVEDQSEPVALEQPAIASQGEGAR